MKKINSFLLSAILCLAAFVGIASNAIGTDVQAYNDSGTTTVAICMPSLEGEYMTNLCKGLQTKYQSKGYDVIVSDAQNNVQEQENQIDYFISQSVNVIVLLPVDETTEISAVNRATDSGITVFIIGKSYGFYTSVTYVDFNYDAAVERSTEDFLNNHLNEDVNIALVFACNNSHGRNYATAIKNKFDGNSKIFTEVIYVDGPNDVSRELTAWLNAHENKLPSASFNCCRWIAREVRQTLQDLGYEEGPDGMPIYGLNSGCVCSFGAFAERIEDLKQQIENGDVVPGDEETYLLDPAYDNEYCDCGDEFCNCSEDSCHCNEEE